MHALTTTAASAGLACRPRVWTSDGRFITSRASVWPRPGRCSLPWQGANVTSMERHTHTDQQRRAKLPTSRVALPDGQANLSSMNTCNLGKVVDGTRSIPARTLPSRSQGPIGPSHFLLTFSTGVSIQRSKRVTRWSSSVLVLCGGKIALLIAQTSHQMVQHHSNVRAHTRRHI